MNDLTVRRARLEPLLQSARSLADAQSERGKRARERLTRSSGLSAEGVNLAISRCLETDPSEPELEALLRCTPTAQVAHVLLSANVFVAAHRALALALAASETVRVRASRREPDMAELLLEGAPGLFQFVAELSPRSGDRLWAYGSDETMDRVAVTLAPGVALHAHGSGFGVCVIDGASSEAELSELLPRLAEDIALFDQRGCLSPRVVLVRGESEFARAVAQTLAEELGALEQRVPRGRLEAQEQAEITAYRDTANFSGQLFPAGLGFVSLSDAWLMPPTGRNVHVLPTSDVVQSLTPLRPMITSCAVLGTPEQKRALRFTLPGARLCNLGQMQSPPFDGPVDRRDL